MVLRFVEAGLGIGFMPEFISREKQAAHAVEAFGIEGFEPRLYSRIYAHSDKWLTPAMEAFARAALTEAGQA